LRRCWQSGDKVTLERGEGNLPPPFFISKNPRILESMIPSLTSCNVDGLLHCIIASKNGEVNDRLAIASLILRSQAQCRSSYTINFLQDFDMIFQFLPASRHLGFEDVQTMVNLISNPVQISSLLIDATLYDGLCISLYNLVGHGILLGFPTASSNLCIQGVKTQHICSSEKATAFPLDIILLDSFPVYTQRLTHKPSLLRDVHGVNASLNHRFLEAMHGLHNELSPSSPLPFGSFPKGEGEPQRIGIVARNPKGQPLEERKTK